MADMCQDFYSFAPPPIYVEGYLFPIFDDELYVSKENREAAELNYLFDMRD